MRRVSIAPMILLILAQLETTLATESVADLPSQSGIFDRSFHASSGQEMRYTLFVPEQLPRDVSQALTLVLHYGGTPSGFYGRALIEQLILPALGPLNSVIIAPVTVEGDWSNRVNQTTVYELLGLIENSYRTNPARRLITGYSMGGAGTWHFIEQNPDYFSAAIPISGFKSIAAERCTTPIYVLHSTTDSIFDAAIVKSTVEDLANAGCDARVDFVEGVDHFNIPAFGKSLENTVPWIQSIWSKSP